MDEGLYPASQGPPKGIVKAKGVPSTCEHIQPFYTDLFLATTQGRHRIGETDPLRSAPGLGHSSTAAAETLSLVDSSTIKSWSCSSGTCYSLRRAGQRKSDDQCSGGWGRGRLFTERAPPCKPQLSSHSHSGVDRSHVLLGNLIIGGSAGSNRTSLW